MFIAISPVFPAGCRDDITGNADLWDTWEYYEN